jgi:hypothetical protein
MKKFFMTSLIKVFALTLLLISGCGEKAPTTAGGENLFSLLPDNATGVVYANFKEFAKLELFDKMIKEAKEKEVDKPGKVFKDYQDFVDKTGIDPQKDIYAIAIGFLGKIGPGAEPDFVLVANLNYNKDKLLTALKEGGEKFTEEDYKGITIIQGVDEHGKDFALAFVNDSIIAGGKIDGVKKVTDLSKGEGKNILANAKMNPYIEKFKSGAIASFVIDFPEEGKKVQDTPMLKMDFSKAEVIFGHVEYTGSAWDGEIAVVCPNEEGNKQLVNALNGLKGMAAMGGPEVEELVNNINLSASADQITLAFNITDELVDKLKKKMEEKAKGMVPPPPPPTE